MNVLDFYISQGNVRVLPQSHVGVGHRQLAACLVIGQGHYPVAARGREHVAE